MGLSGLKLWSNSPLYWTRLTQYGPFSTHVVHVLRLVYQNTRHKPNPILYFLLHKILLL
jgi:hypothetical protein